MNSTKLSLRKPLRVAGAWLVLITLLFGAYLLFSPKKRDGHDQEKLLAGLSHAFRPQVDVRTTVMTSLGALHKHSKWVVLTAEIDVSLTKESHKTVLWDLLDLGTTTVSLDVPGNRVQYVMDLQKLTPDDLAVEGNALILTLPAPMVDQDMVEVQSDPSRLRVRTDVGWARLKSRSGEHLRRQAVTEIRARVVEQAKAEPLMLQAQAEAEKEVKKLLVPLAEHLQPGMHLEVRFNSVFPR